MRKSRVAAPCGGNCSKRVTSGTIFFSKRAGDTGALDMAENDDWWGRAGNHLMLEDIEMSVILGDPLRDPRPHAVSKDAHESFRWRSLVTTLAHSGTLWHALARSGTLWHSSGTLWHTLAHSSTLWHTLAHIVRSLARSGTLWHG